MALSFKGLFNRKKKRAARDGDEPFFTGATLGPGLDDSHDDEDFGGGGGDTGGKQPRDFSDILDDEDWGQDDYGDDDDTVIGHGPKRRKRLAVFAGIGLAAALIAGGGAWWMMNDGSAGPAPEQLAGTPETAPTAAIASGSRVILPMPPAPGLEQLRGGDDEGTAAGGRDAVLDPTAATDRSTARRPWLAEDGAGQEAAEAPAAEAPAPQDQGEAAPAEETAATEETPASEDTPAEAPVDVAETTAPVPTEQAETGLTPTAPKGPEIEEPELPNPRQVAERPTPSYEELAGRNPDPEALREAPIEDLVRTTPNGPLPIAAPDGRKAWTAYGRPFEAPPATPRIAVIVADLGLMPAATTAAIDKLPPDVTLAFSPYGFDLPQAMQQARAAGHETMLSLPLEGRGFPARDPGPMGLNTLLPVNDNLIRLNTVLTKGVGYVGLLGREGEAFTAKPDLMRPVLETVGRAGLLYVQPAGGVELAAAGGSTLSAPTARVDLALDERPFRDAIEARLAALEALARERGSAVAVIEPSPLAFDTLNTWAAGLQQKGLALAPVSAVVRP